MLKLIKFYYTVLSIVSPKTASKSAFQLFQKVRKKDIRVREQPFYDKASHYKLKYKKEDLDCYEFGTEHQDVVVLVHGWDSNAGCMLGIIDKLIETNKRVVTFNLPGHAFYKSNKTNYLECKQAFELIVNDLKDYNRISFISHSFGSGVVAYGLSALNIKVDKLVMLTSPNFVVDIFTDFKNIIGLGNKAFELMNNTASSLLEEDVKKVSTEDKLQLVNFNDALLIHDKNDKVIPFQNTININNAIANSRIESYENIGHYRMLWNDDVIKKTIEFVS
jgi:pimeloyl-ACP methyl ester carboxylesterase